MKKSISIHLDGHLLHLEEEGYRELSTYLQAVKEYFSNYPENTEIVADIETGFAEKFRNRKNRKQIIELEEVRQAIAEMGRVEDFAAQGEINAEVKAPRKLFRDRENRIIAGVAAGIAKYFGIDPIWVRIGFLILTFCYLWGVLLYILLWILIPEAKTPSEKIQMHGHPLTVSNIEHVLRDGVKKVKGAEKMSTFARGLRAFGAWGESLVSTLVRTFGRGFKGILRLLSAGIGFFGIMASIALCSMLIAGGVALFFGADAAYFEPAFSTLFPQNTYFPFLVSILATLLIALLYVLSLSFWFLRRRGLFSGKMLGVFGGLWVISFGTAIGMGTIIVPAIWQKADHSFQAYEAAQVTKDFSVNPFVALEISGEYSVTVRKGPEYNVTLKGDQQLLDITTVNNVEETLQIADRSPGETPRNSEVRPLKVKLFQYLLPPEIVITTPILENIQASSDARVKLEGFSDQDLIFTLNNRAHISAEGDFQKITVRMNSGEMSLRGNLSEIDAEVSDKSILSLLGQIEKGKIDTQNASSTNIVGEIGELELRINDHSAVGVEGKGTGLTATLRDGAYLGAERFEVERAAIEATGGSSARIFAQDDTASIADRSSSIENLRQLPMDSEFDPPREEDWPEALR